jgi:hypothetical protein
MSADPILATNSTLHPVTWSATPPAKEDLHAAEAEVASLYYQSTITSLAPAASEKNQTDLKVENSETKKSLFGRAKDWLWGIFGWGQKQPISELEAENAEILQSNNDEDPFADGIPKLEKPEIDHQRRLAKTIADINRELVNRLKDIAEFEEEMKNSSVGELDRLIFLHLVESSLRQKELNHSRSLLAQEDLFEHHEKNKELQKAHFALIDALTSENKARGVLKWINVGLTAVTVGGMSLAFATGGGSLAVALPIALLGKSVTMVTDGILKYRSDGKTGDLVVIKQEMKTHSATKQDHLSEMQNSDTEVGALLKRIRRLLDNQAKAERASFSRR